MVLIRLLAEALLYYVACSLVARGRENAPGFIRVFVVVLLLAFVSSGIRGVIGDFWMSSALIFVINFFILWIGLGIGMIRTIIAALIVILLRSLMEAAFGTASGSGHMGRFAVLR
jgi:hypothetical protein